MFIATYGTGFFASLFRNPAYAFALYEAVYFFYPQNRWWGYMVPDISYSFFVVMLMMGVLLLNYAQTKHNKLLQNPVFKWIYAVLFLYSIAYFQAVTPESHYQASIFFLKLVLIISIAYKLCDTNTKLDYILYGYMYGAWYLGFVAFQTGRNRGDRLEGIGMVDAPNANDTAAAIAPCLVLCLYYFWTGKKWWHKALAVISGIFIANGLVLINSRGAFIGAAASLGYFMFHMYFSSFQRKHQKTMAAFITIAGLAGAAYIVDDSFYERINTMANTEISEEQESGATRTLFWKAAWEMAKDHPLGAGHLGFNHYMPYYISEDVHTGSSKNRTVHSSWFEALSEAGYPGLFAFIMMLYTTYRMLELCKKELRKSNQVDEYFKIIAIQAALFTFVIVMTFLNRMRADILYWLILYAACAYNIYVLKPRSENSGMLPQSSQQSKK